jgi:hypothetical protein
VRQSVEKTLNAPLEAEAGEPRGAKRYSPAAQSRRPVGTS